ncbi:MAG: PLP-dependent transferase [Proteobacteria bacterium]|nr:PLP-dependent transferase [Pseudomonadota bacterium]
MSNLLNCRMATRAVHAGTQISKDNFIPTVPPIHNSVSYRYENMEDLDGVFAGTRDGYCYTRYGNPTVAAFEEAIAVLESGETAFAFASGMAGIHAALLATGVRSDAPVLAAQDLYGTTYTLLDHLLRSQGVKVHFVDVSNLDAVESACKMYKPVALLVETVSNPLLKIADLPALVDIAHNHSVTLLVDNTFATPCLVQPLDLGADMVIHSATKYLGGHGDVLGGIVVAPLTQQEELYKVIKATGANLGPQEAWMLLRGVRTFHLRMTRHCENGLQVAKWLEKHPRVNKVYYPGLPSHPQHSLAAGLFKERGYGGMLSFELKDAGQKEVFRFFEALNICLPATTLGDVTTLILYPAHSSHRGMSPGERARVGISDGLVRLSVGIEAAEDIIDDLKQALSK